MRTYRTAGMAAGLMIVAALLALPAPALAQSGDGGVGFGVEGGFTFTHLSGTDIADVKSKSGAMGGIWFGGNRAGVVGFMGELTYVVKSVEERGGEQSQLKLHYLEIPAVLRVNIGAPGKNSPCLYFIGGPVVDILLKGDVEGTDVKDLFNGYDIGVLGGVGFEVMRIGVEVRGNWGFKNLAKEEGDFVMNDIKTFALQVVGKIRIN